VPADNLLTDGKSVQALLA